MPKGVPNKRYTGEFKQMVVETMHMEKLSYKEAERQFEISGHDRIQQWERIYLEEGPEGLYVERRGRASAASAKDTGDSRTKANFSTESFIIYRSNPTSNLLLIM